MPAFKKKPVTVLTVVGTRPNFVKVASFLKNLERTEEIHSVLLHTGQHYDEDLNGVFFEQLGIRPPDINLGVGSGSQAQQTASIMVSFELALLKIKPDCVVVVGDVNSTLACAITAKKMFIPVAHIEAGLRSYDMQMPEEINRLVTDRISDWFFTTSRHASQNLLDENVPAEKIHFAGNLMIDSLYENLARAKALDIPARHGLERGRYALLTLHRPSNVDDPARLRRLAHKFSAIHQKCPVLFPAHPRTLAALKNAGISTEGEAAPFILTGPSGYLEMLNLQMNAAFVMTDSGGIQEETTVLNIPCLTLRDNTERPETETLGTNQVIGGEATNLLTLVDEILAGRGKKGNAPELWDGKTGERIVHALCSYLQVPGILEASEAHLNR